MKRAYFDHNATTPVDPRVVDAMIPFLREHWGNASSVHEWGKEARYGVEKARRQVALLAGVPEENLFFNSGGTEANNTVLTSVARRFRDVGCHIITTSIEHPAVYRCIQTLAREFGVTATYLDPGGSGVLDVDAVADAFTPETRLVTVMYANNETGAIQPVPEIVRVAHPKGILVHSDTIQALGKIPLDLSGIDIDFASFSAHKLYGPKGVGALYAKDPGILVPLLQGGGQEMKMRPGTENVASIVGFGCAAELCGVGLEEEIDRIRGMRDRLEGEIRNRLSGVVGCAVESSRLPGTACLCFEGVYGTYVVLDLAEVGIAVSSGSACSANKSEPSHVLLAMGMDEELAQGAVRFSLGRRSTEEEVGVVLEETVRIIEKQRANPPHLQTEELDLLSICD